MVTLEQVKQLDHRISKTVDYIKKVTDENTLLRGRLDTYQQRIDELEKLIKRFKEDQGRIEDGILSALDRLNQFEDALENSITGKQVSTEQDAKKKNSPSQKNSGSAAKEKQEADLSEDEIPADDSSIEELSPEGSENELDIF